MERRDQKRRPRRGFQALGALLLAALPASAQVQVDFSPSVVDLQVGESALVEVRVTGVPFPGLAAFQFDLQYDTIPIDVLNPNEAFRGTIAPFAPLGGDPLCSTVRGTPTCTDSPWFLTSTGRTPLGVDVIDDPAGLVTVAWGTSGAPAPPTGDGAIALIEIHGPYNGTSTVQLANLLLADDDQPPMVIASTGGSLTVTVGTGIANQPPVLSAIGAQAVYEGQALAIPLAAGDGDGNGLTFSVPGLPGFCGLTDLGNGTGSIDCAPALGDAGSYPLTIVVTDDGAPNLTDTETVDLDVLVSTCVDNDGDGYGAPGDVSCPAGAAADCNDALASVNPAASEACRVAGDEDCNGAADAADAVCPAPVCLEILLGAPGTDPTIRFANPATCPAAGSLARNADLIWGGLGGLQLVGAEVRLGPVTPVACSDPADTHPFDTLVPSPGQVDFMLVRETGGPDYGSSTNADPRLPDSGGCP